VAGCVADLGDARGYAALVKAQPACDILVNNLGIYGGQDFFERRIVCRATMTQATRSWTALNCAPAEYKPRIRLLSFRYATPSCGFLLANEYHVPKALSLDP
jgi:hypothetical protein